MINSSSTSSSSHSLRHHFVAGHCVFDHPDGARGEAEIAEEKRLIPLLREHMSIARFHPAPSLNPSLHVVYGLRAVVDRVEWTDMSKGLVEVGQLLALSMNWNFLKRCGIPDNENVAMSTLARPHNGLVELPGVRRIERWVGTIEGGTQDVETGQILVVRRMAPGFQVYLTRFEHIELAAAAQAVRA